MKIKELYAEIVISEALLDAEIEMFLIDAAKAQLAAQSAGPAPDDHFYL